jgi:HD-GYP domain-containing protein (c-di-GMP phosphodiesterase class II)
VALADVYDALTSKRVYKAAFSHEIARSIVVEAKGSHFDPDVVDAFLESEAEFIAIQHRFAETKLDPPPGGDGDGEFPTSNPRLQGACP